MTITLSRARASGLLVRTLAGLVEQFDYQPDQLRVPRGNGDLSGRWVDSPGKVLEDLVNSLPEGDTDRAISVDLRPASAADKEEFKRRFGKPIPPAWKDVHVDFGEGAELVARGRDAAGRQQSLYTSEYHDKQAAKKWSRISQVYDKVDDIEAGLAKIDGDPRKAIARLMMVEGIRVGSTEKQRGKVQSYGAATLRKNHARVLPNGNVELAFTAKEGIPAKYEVDDPELVAYLTDRLEDPDLADDAPLFDASSTDTIALLREISGLPGMKNHDLRTLLANRIALAEVMKAMPPPPKNTKEYNAYRKRVAEKVSEVLRNKPNQALTSYINPAVFAPLLQEVAS